MHHTRGNLSGASEMREMNMKPCSESGQRFGRLTTLATDFSLPSPSGKRYRVVVCECDCGTVKVMQMRRLKNGTARSCGCFHRERAGRHLRGLGTKHGYSRHLLYHIWKGIIQRCTNPRNSGYPSYGGRGIGICNEWRKDAGAFVRWALQNGWAPGLQIDRIDNDGGYNPANCHFVTPKRNSQNTRANVEVTAWGERKCIHEWARDSRCAVAVSALRSRLKQGISPEEAISSPARTLTELRRLTK